MNRRVFIKASPRNARAAMDSIQLKLQEAQNKAEFGSMGPSSSKKSFKAKAKTMGGKPIQKSGGGGVVGDINQTSQVGTNNNQDLSWHFSVIPLCNVVRVHVSNIIIYF